MTSEQVGMNRMHLVDGSDGFVFSITIQGLERKRRDRITNVLDGKLNLT